MLVINERGPKVSMGGIEVTKMTQQMSIGGERTQAEVQRRVHSWKARQAHSSHSRGTS